MAQPLPVSLSFSVDVEAIIAITRSAGDCILAIYEGESEGWAVEQKSDSSPLTRADRDANTLICGAYCE